MTRPSPRQVRAAMDAMAGDALTLEAERIAALLTRLARTIAIGELYNSKAAHAGWIHGPRENDLGQDHRGPDRPRGPPAGDAGDSGAR